MKYTAGEIKRVKELLLIAALASAITYIFASNKVSILISPRYRIFIILAVLILVVFFVITAASGTRSHSAGSVMRSRDFLLVFIIVSIFFISYEDLQQNYSEKNNFELESQAILPGPSLNQETQDESDVINLDGRNFLRYLDYIYEETEEFTGKTIRLTGYVLNLDSLEPGYFVIARLAMFCCAADAFPVGFICEKGSISVDLNQDDWFEIEGTITKKTVNNNGEDSEFPVIIISSFKKITEAADPYVYPFY